MTFAFIPKSNYKIGQIITVYGEKMRVESYTHTGKNVTVHTLEGAPRFKRIVCVCTDSKPIEAVLAWLPFKPLYEGLGMQFASIPNLIGD